MARPNNKNFFIKFMAQGLVGRNITIDISEF